MSDTLGEGQGKGKKKSPKGKQKAQVETGAAGQGQGTCQAGGQSSQQADTGAQAQAAPQKSKAQLKAERRALQEAQRAAKATKQNEPTAATDKGGHQPTQQKQQQQQQQPPKQAGQSAQKSQQSQPKPQHSATSATVRVPDHIKADDDKTTKRLAKKLEKQQIPQRTMVQKKVNLFNHLHQYEREVSLTKDVPFTTGGIHPAILKLGLQYAEGVICGSNARCIALLGALKQVIADYRTPPQKELSRDLDTKIKPYISFLTQCRPLAVSMGNAIKYVKWHITHIPQNMSDTDAKLQLNECINQFVKEKIELAGQAISDHAGSKIQDEDVIMVYGCSSLIKKVLCDAHDTEKKFRVIVTDGRPKLEGREMLRRLVRHGIQCSYVLINTASYVMREVTKVFLGAHALLANGYVMSRVGSSEVSLIAKSYNVPVLVCCETYKFCERVQTDSFVFNELGDPDDLVQTNRRDGIHLADWRDIQSLSLLNLVYDVTPPDLVTMVITDIGMVPCTSVPVVLRVKHAETEAT